MTVLVKRYPKNGELPKEDGIIVMTTNERLLYNQTFGWVNLQNYTTKAPEYWLEEIALPSEEYVCKGLDSSYKEWQYKGVVSNINESAAYKAGLVDTRNFILNHLKSNTNETDKI